MILEVEEIMGMVMDLVNEASEPPSDRAAHVIQGLTKEIRKAITDLALCSSASSAAPPNNGNPRAVLQDIRNFLTDYRGRPKLPISVDVEGILEMIEGALRASPSRADGRP